MVKENMQEFFSRISNGVKRHQSDIMLAIGVLLISLLSFAVGYLTGQEQLKEPIQIERESYE